MHEHAHLRETAARRPHTRMAAGCADSRNNILKLSVFHFNDARRHVGLVSCDLSHEFTESVDQHKFVDQVCGDGNVLWWWVTGCRIAGIERKISFNSE